METSKGKIYAALIAILRDTGVIGKDRKNQQQGYQYRGIDDAYNLLHPVFAKHGVLILPKFKESFREERATKEGKLIIHTIATYDYEFVADDGSSVTVTAQGEGSDMGVKSLNKAFTGAIKTLLFSMFLIPTDDPKDSEADSPEFAAKKVAAKTTPLAPPRQPPAKNPEKAKVNVSEVGFNKLLAKFHDPANKGKHKTIVFEARQKINLSEQQEKILAEWEAANG